MTDSGLEEMKLELEKEGSKLGEDNKILAEEKTMLIKKLCSDERR